MNTHKLLPSELNLKYPQLDFIHLKDMQFAEYNIIYRVNDCYRINNLDQVTGKHQLLFQKFQNKIQQLNLILVDSIFSNIMADLALEVLLQKAFSFNEYVGLRKDNIKVNRKWDKNFYRYKFNSLVHYLAFSNIDTKEVCKGEIDTNRIYYRKNDKEGIDYYPIYCLDKIQKILLNEVKLNVNYSKSLISNQEATICLELFMN